MQINKILNDFLNTNQYKLEMNFVDSEYFN